MSVLLKSVLSLSLSGALLICLLFVCKPLFKDRISKRWQYYMWLVVIARLLVPFSLSVSPVNALFQEVDRAMVQIAAISEENDTHTLLAVGNDIANYDNLQTGEGITNTATWSISDKVSIILNSLWLVWLVGALLLLIRKITIYQGFVKYIKAGCSEVSDIDILNRLAQYEEQAGVKKPVELCVNSLVSSPLLIGFFRPCIVLPTADLSDSDFRYTILHELTHYRHRDMFYKWIVQITLCIHWFNPFVYLMCYEINRACELACDETIISTLEAKEQETYGDMLLNAIGIGGSYHNSIASMTLYENKKMIKERLGAIMNFKKKSIWVMLSSLVLVIGLFAISTALGAYAAPAIEEDDLGAYVTSANIEDGTATSGLSDVSIILDEGVYYIFFDGADESDKPTGGVTEGSIAFVLVRKDSYTSISGFTELETLVDDVTEQLEFMLGNNSKSISQEEANLLVELAAKIQSGDDDDFVDLNTGTTSDKEYTEWGIEKTDNAYYYQNERVCVLLELRADGSMGMKYDADGDVNIRLLRDESGAISKVEYLTTTEVTEILNEFDIK